MIHEGSVYLPSWLSGEKGRLNLIMPAINDRGPAPRVMHGKINK